MKICRNYSVWLILIGFFLLLNSKLYSQNQTKSRFIGIPIKIGNIEVAEFDFEDQLNWFDAKLACEGLGKGWRLPTKNELDLIYRNKDNIKSEFKNGFYWSITPTGGDIGSGHWLQDFKNGELFNYKYSVWHTECNVRAVRKIGK